jgi:AraC family transcriptional regulator
MDYPEKIRLAIQYMEEHSSDKILLEEIAKASFISPFHFHRIFKSFTNSTPREYIERIRLEKAAHLMQYTNISIGDIAYDVGYENHESFSKIFKKIFGSTPKEYRKKFSSLFTKKHSEIKIDQPVKEEIETLNVLFLRHLGKYSEVDKTWRKLIQVAARKIKIDKSTRLIGIWHDNPNITSEENLRLDACIVVKDKIQIEGLDIKTIAAGKYLVFRYYGDYAQLDFVYSSIIRDSLLNSKEELDNRPSFEDYIQSPAFHSPKNYITDIYLPIK